MAHGTHQRRHPYRQDGREFPPHDERQQRELDVVGDTGLHRHLAQLRRRGEAVVAGVVVRERGQHVREPGAGDGPDGAADRFAERGDPKAIEAKLGLTLPLLAQRNWRELERACSAVLAVDGRNATALARLGLAQYSAGNFSGAEATYRRLTEDYPSEMDYRTGLGWALLKLGKSAEAKAIFDGVLAVSPDNVNAKAGLGVR